MNYNSKMKEERDRMQVEVERLQGVHVIVEEDARIVAERDGMRRELERLRGLFDDMRP